MITSKYQDEDLSNDLVPYSPIAIAALVCSFSLYLLIICCCLFQAIRDEGKATEIANQERCIYCTRSRRLLCSPSSNADAIDVESSIQSCPLHGSNRPNFQLQTHNNLPLYSYSSCSSDPSISSYTSVISSVPPSYKSAAET
jgi:hypothetical protein